MQNMTYNHSSNYFVTTKSLKLFMAEFNCEKKEIEKTKSRSSRYYSFHMIF